MVVVVGVVVEEEDKEDKEDEDEDKELPLVCMTHCREQNIGLVPTLKILQSKIGQKRNSKGRGEGNGYA